MISNHQDKHMKAFSQKITHTIKNNVHWKNSSAILMSLNTFREIEWEKLKNQLVRWKSTKKNLNKTVVGAAFQNNVVFKVLNPILSVGLTDKVRFLFCATAKMSSNNAFKLLVCFWANTERWLDQKKNVRFTQIARPCKKYTSESERKMFAKMAHPYECMRCEALFVAMCIMFTASAGIIKHPHRMCNGMERHTYIFCVMLNRQLYRDTFRFISFSSLRSLTSWLVRFFVVTYTDKQTHIYIYIDSTMVTGNGGSGWWWMCVYVFFFVCVLVLFCVLKLLKSQPIHLADGLNLNAMRGERVTIHTTNC